MVDTRDPWEDPGHKIDVYAVLTILCILYGIFSIHQVEWARAEGWQKALGVAMAVTMFGFAFCCATAVVLLRLTGTEASSSEDAPGAEEHIGPSAAPLDTWRRRIGAARSSIGIVICVGWAAIAVYIVLVTLEGAWPWWLFGAAFALTFLAGALHFLRALLKRRVTAADLTAMDPVAVQERRAARAREHLRRARFAIIVYAFCVLAFVGQIISKGNIGLWRGGSYAPLLNTAIVLAVFGAGLFAARLAVPFIGRAYRSWLEAREKLERIEGAGAPEEPRKRETVDPRADRMWEHRHLAAAHTIELMLCLDLGALLGCGFFWALGAAWPWRAIGLFAEALVIVLASLPYRAFRRHHAEAARLKRELESG